MAYIGKRPEDTFRGLASKASFTGDGSTVTFDLSENALDGGTNDIQVFVNNVRQEPGSGKITLDNLILPAADGTADQILTTNGSGQLSFVDNSGGTSWVAVKTSDFTAVGGEGYFVNTTGGAVAVTLPASPSLGDEVTVVDYAGTADTNNITINRNSHKIQGDASNLTISTERAGFTLVYVDATQGWLLKDK